MGTLPVMYGRIISIMQDLRHPPARAGYWHVNGYSRCAIYIGDRAGDALLGAVHTLRGVSTPFANHLTRNVRSSLCIFERFEYIILYSEFSLPRVLIYYGFQTAVRIIREMSMTV